MKVGFIFFLALGAVVAEGALSSGGDRTITKVVKLLQKMLTKSATDAENDKNAYAKYKCYVDKNTAEKKAAIKAGTEQIALLENQIGELQARNGELAGQTASLSRDMKANKDAQKSATTIRDDSKTAFDSMVDDLQKGIGQMKEALSVLTSIQFAQTSETVHKKEAVLLSFASSTQQSLTAASALLEPEKRALLESFLQSPLAAAGSAKGDAIVGILKSLKETFEGNLKNANDSEAAEKKAFDDAIKTLKSSWTKMDDSSKAKNKEMGENDGSMSTKKGQYDEAVKQKAEDEDFLEDLTTMAAKKAKNYEERKMLRANEDAAIAECISILNSDAAFDTFGTTDATKTGATSFLQLRGKSSGSLAVRRQAESLLEQAASQGHSMRLARIAQGLRSGNPFNSVLAEIKKMINVISEEGAADAENKAWCKKENDNSEADLKAKKDQIKSLNSAIDGLDTDINDPKTGLLVSIEDTEESLRENAKAQKDQTATRKDENVAYNKDVMNLADAEDILTKAVRVLKNYYDTLEQHMKDNKDSTNLLQEDPKPPSTYGDFEGQSGEGNKAVTMLQFILDETKKEHTTADTDEKSALDAYDESMGKLKKAEEDSQKSLVNLKESLAKKEKELIEKKADLKDTTEAKEAIESYLLKIKPGCDFINENFDLREKNRATETKALNKATGLIKDTPAYKDAVAADAKKAAGKCNTQCKLDTTNLACKACMADETTADYCAAHAGFPGCK